MIPSTIEQWFVGIPWTNSDCDFHTYWSEVQSGGRKANPFVRFCDEGLHELTHYILASNAAVQSCDPYWGLAKIENPFVAPPDPDGIELQCAAIWILLEVHYSACGWGPRDLEHLTETALMIAPENPLLTQQEKEVIVKNTFSRWPLTRCWEEVQRKDKIVLQALGL